MHSRACILPIFLLFSLAAHLSAQHPDTLWSKTFGFSYDDRGYDIQLTFDGGFVLAGGLCTSYPNNHDIYIIRTDSLGDTLWTRTYGESNRDDVGYSIQRTADGGYIVTGYTGSFGAGDTNIALIKTDSAGEPQWIRTYGGSRKEIGYSVRQTPDGGYVMAGCTNSFGAGDDDVYVVRVDSVGDTVWTALCGGPYDDRCQSILNTIDGGYVLAGKTYGEGGVYIVKIDDNGDTLWTKSFGVSGYDGANAIAQAVDDGFIIAGKTFSGVYWDSSVYLLKLNANGDSLWAKGYAAGEGHDVMQIIGGEYVVVGEADSEICIINTDSLGNEIWSTMYGGLGEEAGTSIVQCADGGFACVGCTNSQGAGRHDIYLLRTKPIAQIAVAPEYIEIATQTWQEIEQDLLISNIGNSELNWQLTESPPVEWLSEDSDSGIVPIGGTIVTVLTFQPAGLKTGTYYDTLMLSSNDPYKQNVNLPVTLDIIEGSNPQIWIDPTLIDIVLRRGESTQKHLRIANAGNCPFRWRLMEIPDLSWCTAQPVTDSLTPGTSSIVTITIDASALALRAYSDTLLIQYGDSAPKSDTIPVHLLVASGDEVLVYPNPFTPSRGHTGIVFGNLPQSGTIEVYAPSGTLAWQHSFNDGNGLYSWNTKTETGGNVASGVYCNGKIRGNSMRRI
jgi:hypothetical protein